MPALGIDRWCCADFVADGSRCRYSCSGCPSTHGDTQLRVYREPKGHTVPPHADPASTFSELAAWVLRVINDVVDDVTDSEHTDVHEALNTLQSSAPKGTTQAESLLTRNSNGREACALNGAPDPSTGICYCDAGWQGNRCAELDVLPAPSDGRYGLHDPSIPTWGGGAVFENGHWHLIVGARAIASANDSITDYPCDSKIVRAVSAGSDVAGPYEVVETIFNRSTWEPGEFSQLQILADIVGVTLLMLLCDRARKKPRG